MFDPHHIGPRRSSSYSRNKGRVIQRRAVNTPSPGYTMTELEQLVPLMRKNGFIPNIDPSSFGKVVDYSVVVDGVDRTNDYTTPTVSGTVSVTYFYEGVYIFVLPNYTGSQITGTYLAIKMVRIPEYGSYNLVKIKAGLRAYRLGEGTPDVVFSVAGQNGTIVPLSFVPTDDLSEPDQNIDFSYGVTLLPM